MYYTGVAELSITPPVNVQLPPYSHSGNNLVTMAQVLSDNDNGSAHVSTQLKHQIKLGSRLTDSANTEQPELSYQKCAVNALALPPQHVNDAQDTDTTTGNRRPSLACPQTIDLLDSSKDDIQPGRSGSNLFDFFIDTFSSFRSI